MAEPSPVVTDDVMTPERWNEMIEWVNLKTANSGTSYTKLFFIAGFGH